MNVAVMQPYLFPWVGYFQLIYQSDVFILYDDAFFINRGYINRNNILSDGKSFRFTVPVPGASQNKRIRELSFSPYVDKLLRTIEVSYKKAPFYSDVMPLIKDALKYNDRSLVSCCEYAIKAVFSYLGLDKIIMRTADLDYERNGSAESKIISICKAVNADTYVNNIGGRVLYNVNSFSSQGIKLVFLQGNNMVYPQGGNEFVPNLSIIDVLMYCDRGKVIEALCYYNYIENHNS